VEIIALIAIGIVGLYILFPVRTIIQRLFSDNKEDEFSPYNDNFMYFLSDYDRANPVTKKQGMERILNAREALMEEQHKEELEGLEADERRKKEAEQQRAKEKLKAEK